MLRVGKKLISNKGDVWVIKALTPSRVTVCRYYKGTKVGEVNMSRNDIARNFRNL